MEVFDKCKLMFWDFFTSYTASIQIFLFFKTQITLIGVKKILFEHDLLLLL